MMIFIFQFAMVLGNPKECGIMDGSELLEETKFRFYTRQNVVEITVRNVTIDVLNSVKFDSKAKTVFMIHGFNADSTKWAEKAKNKLLNLPTNEAINVVTIDWALDAKLKLKLRDACRYPDAADNTKILGMQIANLIKCLVRGKILNNVANVHLVGHSLGAQAAGAASRRYFADTGQKIGRLTGLDPASPGFETIINEWINKNVASFCARITRPYPQ